MVADGTTISLATLILMWMWCFLGIVILWGTSEAKIYQMSERQIAMRMLVTGGPVLFIGMCVGVIIMKVKMEMHARSRRRR